jgi:hypothetical protein
VSSAAPVLQLSNTFVAAVAVGAACALGAAVAPAQTSANPAARATTGTRWRLQDVAAPAVAPNAHLADVSCAQATACVAVGSYVDRRGLRVPLAERKSARGWEIEPIANPSGMTAALDAVSCTVASICMAVGHATDEHGRVRTLAERWDGTGWSVESTPDPGDASLTALYGVSCAAATSCIAVGSSTDASGHETALAERWDGARWRPQPTAPGSPGLTTRLHAVSCSSASACTAVGYQVDARGSNLRVGLAERWDGARWSMQRLPAPAPQVKEQSFSGVSCPTGGSCVAVGSYVTPAGPRAGLAAHWDASGWQPETTAGQVQLSAVSCSSPTRCSAAGSVDGRPAAERRDGVAWTVEATPDPTGSQAGLTGVSCRAADACTAVGTFTDAAGFEAALAIGSKAGGWQRQVIASPSGATGAELAAVACTAPAACVAVGSYRSSAGERLTLAERWDGTRWRRLTTAEPGRESRLLGVACVAADACVAVGSFVDGSHTEVPLVERFDGSNWHIEPTQDFDAESFARLQSVSCAAASTCTAVGSFSPVGGNEQALAERWDGTTWTRQPVPFPEGFLATPFEAVSCPAAGSCAAAGDWTPAGVTQPTVTAARWDAGGWQLQSAPAPAGSVRSGLTGVSCASASDCVAVGDTNPVPAPHSGLPLIERWDGTRWRIDASQTPAGTDDSPLTAVSCSAARSCSAVGASFDAVGYRTLAERWDGARWVIEPTPDAPGADDTLTGVSCTGASACVAVGQASTATPLVLRRSSEAGR